MAVNPRNVTEFNGQIDETDLTNYPYGKAQNITNPGDGTGTPWHELLINDQWGMLQALLTEAGITPSGNADTVQASQYLDAIKFVVNAAPGVVPIGGVIMMPTDTPPTGGVWFAVQGQTFNTTTYAALNAFLQGLPASARPANGTMPDWRDRFPRFPMSPRVAGTFQGASAHAVAQRRAAGGALGSAWSDNLAFYGTSENVQQFNLPGPSSGHLSQLDSSGAVVNIRDAVAKNVALVAYMRAL